MNRSEQPLTRRTTIWTRFRFALITVFVIGLLGSVGWWFSSNYIAREIETQLSELGYGPATVDDISVSMTGVTASGISFVGDAASNATIRPWLTIEKLKISNSLLGLLRGDHEYDAVIVDGGDLVYDVNNGLPIKSEEWDPKQFQLPADKVEVKNFNIALQDSGKEFFVEDISFQISQTAETAIAFDGSIKNLLGGEWQASGSLEPVNESFKLELKSDGLSIATEQWAKLPGMPESIQQWVRADGIAEADLEISGDFSNPILNGVVKPNSILVSLPGFQLNLEVNGGVVNVSNTKLTYQNLTASIVDADGGTVRANGETNFDSFPITTRFEGDYDNVSVQTLNKLAFYIPEVVRGTTKASFQGVAKVESTTRTALQLTARGKSDSATYDDIESDDVSVDVEIEELIVDELQSVESIKGRVAVRAIAVEQDVGRVFDAFEINDVSDFLNLKGSGNATVDLTIPLQTAETLASWGLNASARIPSAGIADQLVKDISVTAAIRDGSLVLEPIKAKIVNEASNTNVSNTEVNESQNNLSVAVRWPLVDTTHAGLATVEVATRNANAAWLAEVVDNLAKNGTGSDVFPPKLFENNSVLGIVNSSTSIELPIQAVEKFRLSTKIFESRVGLENVEFGVKTGELSYSHDSKYKIALETLLNESEALRIESSGRLDQTESIKGEVVANGLEAKTIIRLLTEFQEMSDEWSSEISQYVDRVNKLKPNGKISGSAKLLSLPDREFEITAKSKSISVRVVGPVQNVDVRLVAKGNTIGIERLRLSQERATIEGSGEWSFEQNNGSGRVRWNDVETRTVLKLTSSELLKDFFSTKHFLATDPNTTEEEKINGMLKVGKTNGELFMSPASKTQPDADPSFPVEFHGNVQFEDIKIGRLRTRPVDLQVKTNQQEVIVSTIKKEGGFPIDAEAKILLNDSMDVAAVGKIDELRLSRFFQQQQASDKPNSVLDVTGVAKGSFEISGSLMKQEWVSSGQLNLLSPTINRNQIDDVTIDWDSLGTANGSFKMEAFGGKIELADIRTQPELIKVAISDIELKNIFSVVDSSNGLSGRVSGTATLNDWSLADTRWADVQLQGSSIRAYGSEFGDFNANAKFLNENLEYRLSGTFLGGKLTGAGFAPIDINRFEKNKFPLRITFKNAALSVLNRKSNIFRALGSLEGRVAATADVLLAVNERPTGNGRVSVEDLKWKSELISKDASIRFNFDGDKAVLDDVRMDLKRGEVAARVTLPFRGAGPGSYRVDMRQLDATRLATVALGEDAEATGLLDVRLEGQIGNQITGSGYLGFDRASLHHVAGQSARLPIRFRWSPKSQAGLVEFRRSRFRLFDGRVAGDATLKLGPRWDLDVNLVLTNVKSGEVIATIFDINDVDQGVFSGRLRLSGRGLKSVRDLDGQLTGSLDRANVLKLPVLNEVARFLSTGDLINQSYESDSIDIRLSRGRAEVRQLNFRNSLATIIVDGYAYLDGRLDLDVAARVERLNQPTLIDQFLDSPLAQLRVATPQFVTRAAEFLSERVVFLHVGGDFKRPQLRLDSAKQLREETIRYFLRDTNLFPFDSNQGK